MSWDIFIYSMIEKFQDDGRKIVNNTNMPIDIQHKIWKYVYSFTIQSITPAIRISWNYGKSENLKVLLAKTDDPGILQFGHTDFVIDNTEYYTTVCLNCSYYRFPCLNCHYYVYPSIEACMWKNNKDTEPKLPFRWGAQNRKYSQFELLL